MSPDPKINSAVVERAIGNVEALIQTSGAVSRVDRIHTALHGYLRAVCDVENIVYGKDDSMTKLLKLLKRNMLQGPLALSNLEIYIIIHQLNNLLTIRQKQ